MTSLSDLITKRQSELVDAWNRELLANPTKGLGRISDAELRKQTNSLLQLMTSALESNGDVSSPPWSRTREFLEETSRSRVLQGFDSAETATFVFSMKKPLFAMLRDACKGDANELAERTWQASLLVDELGLHTVKTFQRAREAVVQRQQTELLELSTPVVKLWDGVLALPLIGTLDSARTQVVMESLLKAIVDTNSETAILDITGVPTVDTLVAQHLIRTVTAIRLMGADCIISGVRPQIAQTIVHLGIDLTGITTKATLADALSLALKRRDYVVTRRSASS
jgi:rsbT co-antagonist protein RsbR